MFVFSISLWKLEVSIVLTQGFTSRPPYSLLFIDGYWQLLVRPDDLMVFQLRRENNLLHYEVKTSVWTDLYPCHIFQMWNLKESCLKRRAKAPSTIYYSVFLTLSPPVSTYLPLNVHRSFSSRDLNAPTLSSVWISVRQQKKTLFWYISQQEKEMIVRS